MDIHDVPPTRAEIGPSMHPVVARVDGALDRLGLRSVVARDCLIAVFWAVCSVALLLPLLGPLAGDLGLSFSPAEASVILGIVTVQSLLLAVRHLAPVTVIAAVTGCQLALTAVVPADATVRVAAPIIAAYTVGVLLPPSRLARVIRVVLVTEVVGGALITALLTPGVRSLLLGEGFVFDPPALSWTTVASAVLSGVLVVLLYGIAVLMGVYVAMRREHLQLLRDRALEAISEQSARADAAIGAERSRMARELHDIAAHHLSGLVVQAAAAERLIDHDPEAAKSMARSIRAQGKETLANLRMAVGVLRDRDRSTMNPERRAAPDEDGRPVPGLGVLDGLIDAARESGDRIECDVTGDPVPLPPLADVTAYRVVQESLANARQHAQGALVRVSVDYRDRRVVVQVINERASGLLERSATGRPGFGLAGMSERAQLVGAQFDASRTVDGGWAVALDIPVSAEPAASAPRPEVAS